MSFSVLVIGIGSGDPAQLTAEAVAALNRADLFLVADKGGARHDLVAIREALCRAVITHDGYRFVEVADPERGPDRERDRAAYEAGVADWHARRAQTYAEVIKRELPAGGTVGFLVWGDPAFYDSTIRIVEAVRDRGVDLSLTVLPGISSLQLLAARHRIPLNQVGRPVHLTTGRRLVTDYTPALGDVLVMLDGDLACTGLLPAYPDLEIFWGAQLGLPDEALVAGRLGDVLPEISRRRATLRGARGWVMDTYLLRDPSAEDPSVARGPRATPSALRLRPPRREDENAVRGAHAALAEEEVVFALDLTPEIAWSEYLDLLTRIRAGVDLAPGRVRALSLVAQVDGRLVGRISVRLALNDFLLAEGGHIGYVVLPEHRRRGYATEILRQGLILARAEGLERVLVTADEGNVGSIRAIERCGGVLDPDWPRVDGSPPKLRYWFS